MEAVELHLEVLELSVRRHWSLLLTLYLFPPDFVSVCEVILSLDPILEDGDNGVSR